MASPVFFPKFRAFDHSTGAPLASGQLFTYIAGTSAPQTTWTDTTLSVANTNPVILDANGEANVFVGSLSYKFILKDMFGTIQWTEDNINYGNVAQSISGNNVLINSSFELNQIASPITGATSLFLCDGWAGRIATGSGVASDYTITAPATTSFGGTTDIQSAYVLHLVRNTGSTATLNASLVQNIETADVSLLVNKFITLSFWIAGSTVLTATCAPFVYGGTGTDESWQTAGSITGQYTLIDGSGSGGNGFVVPTGWTFYSFTSSIPVTFGTTSISVVFTMKGYNGTAGGGGFTDSVDFDNVQLEVGVVPTSYQIRSFEDELLRCQRRYYKSFPYSTAPAQNAGINGSVTFPQVVGAVVNSQTSGSLRIPNNMRDSAATMTTYNPSAANAQVRNTTVNADTTNTTPLGAASNTANVSYTTAAGSAAGNTNQVHYTIDRRF